uniref:Dynein heavy chain tail domain-containing protein n=1 Tax=Anopheles maculatus TaxID=74869 RepID=A0A182SW49_9DIPT
MAEVRYLKCMKAVNIPEKAQNYYASGEALWAARMKLSRIVEWYNEICKTCAPCEFELIQKEIDEIDAILADACSGRIDWNNFDQSFIDGLYDKLYNLYSRVLKAKANIQKVQNSIRSWGQIPLYERLNGDNTSLINIENRSLIVQRRLEACLDTKKLIEKVMDENFKLYFDYLVALSEEKLSSASGTSSQRRSSMIMPAPEQEEQQPANVVALEVPDAEEEQSAADTLDDVPSLDQSELGKNLSQLELFRPYEEYVDSILSKEIMDAVHVSVKYIKFEMENRLSHNTPIFEIKYELHPPDTRFCPSLDPYDPDGFFALVESMITDIYCMSDMIPRVAQPPENERIDEEGNVFPETYISKHSFRSPF